MIYDPVQAIFDGVTSTFARVFLAWLTFILAYETFFISQGNTDLAFITVFPLVTIGVLFAWATKGFLFIVGLAALLSFFIVAFRFLNTTEPKALLAIMYGICLIYFIPLGVGI